MFGCEDRQQSGPRVCEKFMVMIAAARSYKRFIWLCLVDLQLPCWYRVIYRHAEKAGFMP